MYNVYFMYCNNKLFSCMANKVTFIKIEIYRSIKTKSTSYKRQKILA